MADGSEKLAIIRDNRASTVGAHDVSFCVPDRPGIGVRISHLYDRHRFLHPDAECIRHWSCRSVGSQSAETIVQIHICDTQALDAIHCGKTKRSLGVQKTEGVGDTSLE